MKFSPTNIDLDIFIDQKTDNRNIIVDGEFQILNRKFEFNLLDKGSAAFKELSFNLSGEVSDPLLQDSGFFNLLYSKNIISRFNWLVSLVQLNRLFRRSDVAMCYQHNEILEVTPNMTIKSIVVFRNCDHMNVGRIGLAFLRSLRLHHGHTFLGQHTINVQSIGFQSKSTFTHCFCERCGILLSGNAIWKYKEIHFTTL